VSRLRWTLFAPLLLAVIVGVALLLTADGGGPEAAAAPDVRIARLDGEGEFALASLSEAERPTLLWFWAPWCTVCNASAATIEQMAVDARGEMDVIAIGGRDQAANGPAFVEEHDLRTPMVLFDEPMAAWEAYRIPGQPVAVLLDRAGRERQRWHGPFQPADVLTAARAL
jgi:thiol-disulfide isomerase/thioredoxin